MDIKKVNRLVMFLHQEEEHFLPEEVQEFEAYLQEHADYVYARIFHEYTQLDISDRTAKQFIDRVWKSKTVLEQTLGRPLDLRVVFLDYLVRHLGTIRQASEPRIIETKILHNLNNLIVQDELTGLYNFRHYKTELEKEFSRSLRNETQFSLAIMDIDDFKLYNDTFGHQEGNKVLRRIGQIIHKTIRKIDIGCRYGGEEFALILPQTGSKGAFILIDRIRNMIEHQKLKQKVTISGGVATFLADTKATDRSLFECADKALYHSKELGKNMITLYSSLVKKKVLA